MTPLETTGSDSASTTDSIERPPGVETPARQWRLQVAPELELAVHEWGDEAAPPLFLAHGGADFARTFDRFAPLLADSGWRVVSWDHRGHGDSDRAALYSWLADLRDALLVIEAAAGSERAVLVGHSKGGGLFSHLAAALPERFTHFVNIDGIPRRHHPGRRQKPPLDERIQRRNQMFAAWLDHRRRAANKDRRPGSLEELAERRARMNPRLPLEWLRYLVTVGASRSRDGWRWNLDPVIRMGGIGPWRPDWGLKGLRDITVPMLAILGRQREPMGWGNDPDEARADLPPSARLEVYEDSGHFVHIEHPERVAEHVLGFLGETSLPSRSTKRSDTSHRTERAEPGRSNALPPAQRRTPGTEDSLSAQLHSDDLVWLRHARLRLALHRLHVAERRDSSSEPPLLLLPGLGESVTALRAGAWRPDEIRALGYDVERDWWALDLSGHGLSDWAAGGGYSVETLLGDVDLALERLGSATLCGRGLGAYLALLAQGARPSLVRGVLLCDGPGLHAGGAEPHALQTQGGLAHALASGVSEVVAEAQTQDLYAERDQRSDRGDHSPDPLAAQELETEVRPPGYVGLFVRQATALSGLDKPIRITTDIELRSAPPWWRFLTEKESVERVEPASASVVGGSRRS